MKQSITLAIISIIAVALGVWGLVEGIERQERYECAKWASERNDYAGYYLVSWQKEQCGFNDETEVVSKKVVSDTGVKEIPELKFNWTPINDRTERPEALPTIRFNQLEK